MSDLWDQISGLLGAGAGFYATDQQIGRLQDLGSNYYNNALNLGQTAFDESQFEPFTITSTYGSGSFDPRGGTSSISLDPSMAGSVQNTQATAQNLINRYTSPTYIDDRSLQALGYMGTGGYQPSGSSYASQFGSLSTQPGTYGTFGSLFGLLGNQVGAAGNTVGVDANRVGGGASASDILGLMGETGTRNEAEIYNMLESMQQPGRERERLDLENRLFGQGRLGVQTDAYGGTPEQLAMEKAIQESKSTNAFNAYRMAQEEAFRNRSARADEVARAYGLDLQSRGQDISQEGMFGNLGLSALDRALTERGQDISQMDILGRLGLGAFDASLAERQQNIAEGFGIFDRDLSAFDRALAERSQDIGQQSIFSDQALKSWATALQEQGLLGDQAAQLAQLSFLPQQMLLQELGLGLDAADIAARNALGGSELGLTAGIGGLDALFNAEAVAANLAGQRDINLLQSLFGDKGDDQQGLIDLLGNLFG